MFAIRSERLFLRRDSQGLHLAVQVAALESEYLGRAAYVAVVVVKLLEDIVTLIGVACLMQSRKIALGSAPAAVAVDERRKMLAIETRRCGIHDHNALDHVAQF